MSGDLLHLLVASAEKPHGSLNHPQELSGKTRTLEDRNVLDGMRTQATTSQWIGSHLPTSSMNP